MWGPCKACQLQVQEAHDNLRRGDFAARRGRPAGCDCRHVAARIPVLGTAFGDEVGEELQEPLAGADQQASKGKGTVHCRVLILNRQMPPRL